LAQGVTKAPALLHTPPSRTREVIPTAFQHLTLDTNMPWVWKGSPKGFGKGWGKWGGKGYGGRGKSKPQALPEDFTVDSSKVYNGTVTTYYKFKGYGFITPDEAGTVPGDKVFAYWKNIKTEDRYPTLTKDMKVQFTLAIVEKQGVKTVQAESIAAPGGANISCQDEADQKKDFVGGQSMRYTGKLKFFLPKQGYGYITIDPGFQYDKEGVPAEIKAEADEMNCGGGNPAYAEDVQVEFGIWVTARGAFKAYNVTLPGGKTMPAVESLPTTGVQGMPATA